MAENTATIDDVRAFYPALAPAQEDQAKRLLSVAWLRLVGRPGLNLARRLDAGDVDPELVRSIQGEMVAAVLRNPEGARSRDTTVTIDDYTEREQVTIDQARSEGLLYPTEAMLAMIRESRRGAWTVRPS